MAREASNEGALRFEFVADTQRMYKRLSGPSSVGEHGEANLNVKIHSVSRNKEFLPTRYLKEMEMSTEAKIQLIVFIT